MEDALRALILPEKTPISVQVLILVVMEDALRDVHYQSCQYMFKVLILVVMEDALRDEIEDFVNELDKRVLILVVMEDALRALPIVGFNSYLDRLNPCCNGRCSASTSYCRV